MPLPFYIVSKHTEIKKIASGVTREPIERIIVHALDKPSGHWVQQIDICYRFNIAVSMVIADRRDCDKNRKAV